MRSLGVVSLLLVACAGTSNEAPVTISRWLGTASWEGHFEKPHATRTIPVTVTLARCGTAMRCELHEQWRAAGPPSITTIVLDAERACWISEDGDERFRPDNGENARLVVLLQSACERGEDARVPFQHPRLGDVVDAATRSGDTLDIAWHRATDSAVLALQRVERAVDAAPPSPATFVVDAARRAPSPPPATVTFRTLAPDVHEITLPDAESRSLVVEFADHVVLCETTVDNDTAGRMLAVIDERLPGKPIHHVLFGHYHPHYTGGLRAVMARGATVVAPPLGAAFAREIAARPFATPPDAFARSGLVASVEAFTGERRFHDDTNELVAIDIGSDSHHTEEYVVFWLPRQGLLFQGDLGWYGVGRGLRAGGERARGLVAAIDARHLPVRTLVQAWPTDGVSTLPLDELRTLLAK